MQFKQTEQKQKQENTANRSSSEAPQRPKTTVGVVPDVQSQLNQTHQEINNFYETKDSKYIH